MPARQNPLYAKLTQDRPKAVVFDLDMTLFDNSQRFTDARRAGLVDKAGKPKVKGMMSKRQAFNKRNKFLYSNKELAKDVVIPGATQLVSDLKNDGYTIIYLTARPEKYQEQTIQQLESNGFPLFRDVDGNSLVFSKPADKTQVPAFKGNKVRELLGNYKVEMVFDDNKSNLEEIAKLGIPGLYASLSDHVKHNPEAHDNKYGGQNVTGTDDITEATNVLIDPDDDDNEIFGVERTVGENMNPMGPNPLPNPLPKPKKKKLSNGKYRKEPKKTYVNRMMETKKMKTDFPDRKQRYAVTMTLVEKFYGKTKANPANNLANTFGALLDTGSINDTKFAKLMDAKTPAKISSDKISFKGVGTKNVKVTFKQVKDPSKVITYNDTMSEGDNPLFIHAMSEPSMKTKVSGKSLVVDGYLMNGWRTFHKYDTHFKSKMYEAQGQYDTESFESVGYTVSQICQDKDGFYLWDGKEKLRFDKKELPATIQYPTIALVRETPKSSIKLMLIHYTGAVKTNPAHPSKVEKAKKLYKHMNGKEPAKIEKKKLDLGDVWYQVGEGGCWQIGYISGKDNGRDDQKYTHVFNEETKDGNFPKLYATMPENGKPMLIITGGTWKIKTDATGTAWIYD
tara:strand:+ start:13683 stop:15548 length:1866 start_codon:yes stop_codon:yes gene_type:complete